MAADKITYSDKVAVQPQTIHINQIWDADMNEIKTVVNNHADLLDTLQLGTINPVENSYADITALLADQANQTEGYFNYVVDASADPNITSGDAYYEKKASSTLTLADDYILLSDTQVEVILNSISWRIFRIESINDDSTPLTSVSTNKIGIDYNTTSGKVTSILFNRQFSDTIVNITALSNLKLRLYNQNSRVIEVTSITSFTTVGNYIRANVESDITASDLSVNNKLEVYFDESGSGGTLEYQTEITTSTTLTTQEGLNKVYPVNSSSNIQITIPNSTYSANNVINFERRGTGSVEIVKANDNVKLRGVRDINNKYFIQDRNSLVSVICRGSNEFSVIGNLVRGYSGQVTTSSYGNLPEAATNHDVTVIGTGFSENMVVTVSANATLNSWTYVSSTEITLNLDAVGNETDTVTVTYDNGDEFIDTDAITIGSAALDIPIANLVLYSRFHNNLTDETGNSTLTASGTAYANGVFSGVANESKSFTASNHYVRVPDNAVFDFSGNAPFSIVKNIKFSASSGDIMDVIANKRGVDGGDANADKEWFICRDVATGKIRVIIYDGATAQLHVIGNTVLADNTAYNIIVTYGGGTTISSIGVTINGVDETLSDNGSTGTFTSVQNLNAPIIIGTPGWTYTAATPENEFLGDICAFGIFNVELTASQKADISSELQLGNDLL